MKLIDLSYIYRSVITALAVLCFTMSYGQQARLRGAVDGDHLKLYWETNDWPVTMAGFNLKRKEGNGSWKALNTEVIYPQVDDRNWSNLGLNESQSQHVRRTFQTYLASGDLQVVRKEVLINRLVEADGLQSGDRLRMKVEFEIALILGFGYIDNTYKKNNDYTYGLFRVDTHKNEAPEPIAVFAPEKVKSVNPQVDFHIRQKNILLEWNMTEEEYMQAALIGYRLYREESVVDTMAYLSKIPVGYIKNKNSKLSWEYMDTSADPNKDYIYHLVPVTLFQTEYKAIKIPYVSKKNKPIFSPGIDSLGLKDNVHVYVSWSLDSLEKSERKRIITYTLERTSADSLKFKPVFSFKSPRTTSFTDTSAKQHGKTYYYRLMLDDKNGKKWEGVPKAISYRGYHKPQKTVNIKAEFKIINNNPFVHITWDKASHQTTLGYLIESDELKPGTFLKLGSIPLIRDNQFLYPVRTYGGRDYKFRLIPTNDIGLNGDTTEISCPIPFLELPQFKKVDALLTNKHTVEVSWQYPSNIPLKGFRVYINDKQILSEVTVNASQRKVTIGSLTTDHYGKLNRISVKAIGAGAEKISLPHSIYIKQPSIKQPENFTVRLFEEKGKWYAELSWKHKLQNTKELKGYKLMIDQEVEGDIHDLVGIKNTVKNIYKYEIPDPYRDSYTFHIAAISRNGEISPSSEIIVNLDKQKNR
jgi:hypothetical protein